MNVHSVMPRKGVVPCRWAAYVQCTVCIIICSDPGPTPVENPPSNVISDLLFCKFDDLSQILFFFDLSGLCPQIFLLPFASLFKIIESFLLKIFRNKF